MISNQINNIDEIPIDIIRKKSIESGEASFGILIINFSSANGIPNGDFKGLLKNVNATFYNGSELIVARIIFLGSTILHQTINDLNVKIDFFYGEIRHHENISLALGFSKGIKWAEV
ncbi:MAG: hypothetical protein DRP08_06985 [Candidatus Aenigmatarchaeota archaeon]|nr:MAG: hypothetical protein DRP08_06985 [Candidatus Aenigmarchaeota archaeon]